MNEKRSLQDLIDQLSEKHELSLKEAEAVVKGMFNLIEEALERDKYVKLKGLGTFKLTEVDRRESVDVNTGERIEIQGHTKVSFTPDTSMKDQINKPFAHFETVILNEGTQLEDTMTETEEELAEELRTENEGDDLVVQTAASTGTPFVETVPLDTSQRDSATLNPKEDDVDSVDSETASVTKAMREVPKNEGKTSMETEEGTPKEKEGEKAPAGTDASSGAADVKAQVAESVAKQRETEVASLTIVAKKVEITSEQVTTRCVTWEDSPFAANSSPAETVEPAAQSLSSMEPAEGGAQYEAHTLATYRRWIWILTALLLLSLSVGAYLWFQYRPQSPSLDPSVQPTGKILSETLQTVAADSVGKVIDSTKVLVDEPDVPEETLKDTSTATSTETSSTRQSAVLSDTLEYEITGTLTNHTLKEGESLIKISLKYFGNKELWSYIVKYNAAVIRDANRVPVGTQLRIPKLTPRP